MSRTNKTHLLHIRSSVVENGNPKLPQPEDISYGELAINYAKDNEVLSIKNSANEIVPLFFGGSIKEIHVNGVEANIENRVATVEISGSDENVGEYTSVEYPTDFSGATNVSGDQTIAEAFNSVETTVSNLTQEVLDNELVTEKAIKALGNAAGTIDENDIITYVVNENANYINVANSLADADDILDGIIKGVDTNVTNLNNRIDELEESIITSITVNDVDATIVNQNASVVISGSDANVGEYTSVEYPTDFSGATNVSGDQTIAEAFNAVETTVSSLTQEVLDNELVTEKAIKALGNAAGTIDENDVITYVVNENANYINVANSLADADDILDAAIKDANDKIDELSAKTLTSITVNNVNATITNGAATVEISGSDANVGEYTSVEYPQTFSGASPVSGDQTIAEAFNSVETSVSNLTQEVINNEKVVSKAISAIVDSAGLLDEDNVITYDANENANYINVATSLAHADNILDSVLKNVETGMVRNVYLNNVQGTKSNNNVYLEISGSNENVGAYTSIEYPSELSGAIPVSGTQTIAQAFSSVETTVSSLTQEVIDNELVTEKAIKALGYAAGTIDENNVIAYVVNENGNYINVANSLADADNILDSTIKSVADDVDELNTKIITSITVNGVDATIANQSATVVISGNNINVGTYTTVAYPQELSGAVNVSGTQTIAQALNSIETTVSALTQEVIHNEETDANAIFDMANAIGNVVDTSTGQIKYIPNQTDPIIGQAQSYNEVVLLLSAEIQDLKNRVTVLEGRL